MRLVATGLIALLVLISVALAAAPILPAALKTAVNPRSGADLVQLGSIPASGEPPLPGPTGVAVDEKGRIYVADPSTHEVRVFDHSGRQLFAFGALGARGPKHLVAPVQVQINGSDEVLVTDRGLKALYAFSRSGAYRGSFVAPSSSWSPVGVGVAPDGVVYVTDVGDPARHGVRAFSQSGMLLYSFGKTGEVPAGGENGGSFYYPSRVLADADSVFVADSNNGRVQVFDRSGRFRYIIHTNGVPRGLAFDSKGHLIVADALGGRVMVYARSGAEVGSIGSNGDFRFPNDVATDADGRIFIADRGGASVQVWGRPEQANYAAPLDIRSVRWPWLLVAVPALALIPLVWRRQDDAVESDQTEEVAA